MSGARFCLAPALQSFCELTPRIARRFGRGNGIRVEDGRRDDSLNFLSRQILWLGIPPGNPQREGDSREQV